MMPCRRNNPAKAFLMQYRGLTVMLESLRRNIERMRESLTSITAPIKEDPVQASGQQDRMAATIAAIIDAEAGYAESMRRAMEQQRMILEAIESVPDATQRAVLALRYTDGLDWISVADKVGYAERQTFVLHGRGLAEVNKWLAKTAQENAVVNVL